MKKSLLFSLFSFSLFGASAQIVLTSADIASPTKVLRQAHDTMPTVTPGGSGPGQTWNMTALSNDQEDTLTFLPYSAAPNPKFSSANIAVKFGSSGTQYAYLNNSSTNAVILGNSAVIDFGGGPSQVNSVSTPGEIIANWPATFLSTFNNNYRKTAKFYFGTDPGFGFTVDSVRQHGTTMRSVQYDAYGSVTTPLGTYNTLRQKQTIINFDSTDLFITMLGGWQNNVQTTSDTGSRYSWWANSIGFPIVELDLDAAGNVTGASWLQSLPMTVGINEYTAAETSVFPNPAQDNLSIKVDPVKASAVQLYDVAGRLSGSFIVTNELNIFDVSGFANGIYTFTVVNGKNEIISRGKFTVAH